MVDIPRFLSAKNGAAAFAVFSLLLAPGCGAESASKSAAAATDAGTVNGDAADSSAPDSSGQDSNATDSGAVDGGLVDGGLVDGGLVDGGPSDSGGVDSGASLDALPDGSANDASGDISVPVDVDELNDGGDTIDAVPGPQPCSPALALAPAVAKILPYDLRTLAATGGTGAYQFALTSNASGAVLNKYSGAYLSGSKSGVTDVIKLTDSGCVGSAFSKVTVVEPMSMTPLEPWVAYKQVFKFAVANGSGNFTFGLLLNATGGAVNKATGTYTAGSKDGDDQVRVTDTATGETSTAVVHVRKGATLSARPPRLVVPVGSTAEVVVSGGSGHYGVKLPAGVFKKVGAAGANTHKVVANQAGSVVAVVKDLFTGETANVQLFAVGATEVVQAPAGDGYQAAQVRTVPDLDGDGGDEVVVSVAEGDGQDNNSGAVYLYRSKKGGLDLKPAQILYGVGKDTRFGHAMTVADVDGDKRADLIVGAPLADVGTTNNGAIYIYKGLKTGLFAVTPMAVLKGPYNSDQLGWGVAVCDVNGDGVMDVAGGAMYAEDHNQSPIVSSTGALLVWLGHQQGFLELPDVRRYGKLPNAAGKWTSLANARIGWDLASGDVDGDNVCDLAVSSLYYKGTAANDGLVALYRGEKASAESIGGPSELPVRVWTGVLTGESGSQFGRSIAMADVDADGKDELVVGQLNWRGKPANLGRGAAYIFDLNGVTAKPAAKVDTVADATWTVEGPNSYDYYGYKVAVGDATGDGIPDVLLQAANGEVPKGPTNAGAVLVFAGVKGKMPATTPTSAVGGLVGGDYFGLGMAAVGDLDGDKLPELVVFASQDDTLGYNLGRPYYLPSKPGAKLEPMAMPSKPSGTRFAWHTRFVGDLNGDGFADLAVGAPFDPANHAAAGAKPVFAGTRAGVTYIYKGTAAGVDTSKPAWRALGFYGHSAHDHLGWYAAPGGDFDGDGVRDLAVLARYDDRPSTFNGNYTKGTKCAGGARGNASATYVFRGQKGDWPAATPAWVAWGPQASQPVDSIAMGMDINGDGLGDLVASGLNWDAKDRVNAGGWGVYWGRAAATAGIAVVCEPDVTYIGVKANDYVGRDVVAMHDIDGDGCDEFAVGADGEDHGLSAQGTVHIVFGWGKKCASMVPRELVLTGGASNARAGNSLDAGADIDGDKVPDLLIGGFNYSDGSASVGTAWVVTGAYLKTLKPTAIVDGKLPVTLHPIVQPGSTIRVSATGIVPAGQFGWSVAFVPGLEKDGRAGILIGCPSGDVRSGALTGGAELFRWSKSATNPGLSLYPMLAITGESKRPGGMLGYSVSAGLPKPGKPVLVMGGYSATPATSTQIDQGAAYIVTVAQP